MDDAGRQALVDELEDLAGGWGVPAAVQYSVDQLTGSSTAAVGYDFSVALGLLLGDLAAVIETSGADGAREGGRGGDAGHGPGVEAPPSGEREGGAQA